MIQVKVDEEALMAMYKEMMEKSIKKFEGDVYFMDRKQLIAYLNMSWNTIIDKLLYREGFPKTKLGTKWIFQKKAVEAYMDEYYLQVCDKGGDFQIFTENNVKKAG